MSSKQQQHVVMQCALQRLEEACIAAEKGEVQWTSTPFDHDVPDLPATCIAGTYADGFIRLFVSYTPKGELDMADGVVTCSATNAEPTTIIHMTPAVARRLLNTVPTELKK